MSGIALQRSWVPLTQCGAGSSQHLNARTPPHALETLCDCLPPAARRSTHVQRFTLWREVLCCGTLAAGTWRVLHLRHHRRRCTQGKLDRITLRASGTAEVPRAVLPLVSGKIIPADAPAALRSLQRLELPFFATHSEFVEVPMNGLRLRGNFRANALDSLDLTRSRLTDHLASELGRCVEVHILEREKAIPGSRDQNFELFVVSAQSSSEVPAWAVVLSLASIAATASVTQALGSNKLLQAVGAVFAPGSTPPLAALFCLLAIAEGVQRVVAAALDVKLMPPILLPSPQVGVMGSFSSSLNQPTSRKSAAIISLSFPMALTFASCLLLWYGQSAGSLGTVTLQSFLSTAWLLSLGQSQCDISTWAGLQGILMAAYALLPHSPNGQIVLSCLVGRAGAQKCADVAAYLHPCLGLLALAFYGQGWQVLPMWWAFLIINFAGRQKTIPLEEVSEMPLALRLVAMLALGAAAVAACPIPIQALLDSTAGSM